MSRPPVIELHIEELVLRGVSDVDREALQTAVEEELGRLLTVDDAPWAAAAGSRPSLTGGEIGLTAGDPQLLGQRLAAAVHGALSGLATRGGA